MNPNHPFLKTLRRLPTKTQKRFKRWLESELYTSRKDLAPHYDYVLASLGRKTSPAPAHRRPPTSLQLTYLRKELDVFLAIRHFLTDEGGQARATIGAHLDLKDNLKAAKLRDSRIATISNSQELEHYHERSLLDQKILTTLVTGSAPHLKSILRIDEHSDRIFLISKLQQACRLVSHNILHATEASIPSIDEAFRIIEADPKWLEDPLIPLYYHAYLALTANSTEDFTKLTELLSSEDQKLESADLRDLFITLLNTSIRKMNKGEEGFDRYALNLFQLGLRESVILVNGKLSGASYLNITAICLKLNELDWLKGFLPAYQDRLSPRDQTTYYPYCMAIYAYEEQDLSTAEEYISRFDFTASNVPLQLHARIVQTKVYYDLDKYELLDSHLNSFSVFLSRHKELGYYREIVLGFVRVCQRLLLLPARINNAQRERIAEDIAKISVESYRTWLLERLS